MLNADEVQAVIYEGLPAASEEGLRIEEVGARRARVRSPRSWVSWVGWKWR